MKLKAKKPTGKDSCKVKSLFNENDLAKLAEEYDTVSSKIKELSAIKKGLAEKLKAGAMSIGVQDDKGSYYAECGSFVIGKVAKKSIKLDQDKAVEFFRKRKMEEYIVRNVTYTVSEKDIEEQVATGAISEDDVMSFMSVNPPTYSVSVVRKEEMPEVQQSVASIRKKR